MEGTWQVLNHLVYFSSWSWELFVWTVLEALDLVGGSRRELGGSWGWLQGAAGPVGGRQSSHRFVSSHCLDCLGLMALVRGFCDGCMQSLIRLTLAMYAWEYTQKENHQEIPCGCCWKVEVWLFYFNFYAICPHLFSLPREVSQLSACGSVLPPQGGAEHISDNELSCLTCFSHCNMNRSDSHGIKAEAFKP